MGNLLSQYAGRHYRYDSRGNLMAKRANGSLTKLEWDSHNRLSRLIAPDGQRTDYHYDPLGRRIAKISQSQATLYGWDGDVLAFETRDGEAVHYLFEPDRFVPLAQVHTDAIRGVKVPAWSQHNPYDPDKDPLRQAGPEPQAPKAVYYYHTDHLGTPQALTDEHGALALEMDYQAWGQAREVIADAASKAGIRNPFRFQGQYHDDESGLHYNRHRYYDPEIGRFISRDPIGLVGGINTHSYTLNPVIWIDPLGLSPTQLVRYKPRSSVKPCPGGRATAIHRAWGEERELVAAGGGSREWSASEHETILNTKNNAQLSSIMSKAGYTGLHINSVKGNGELGTAWKGDPRNIVFLQNGSHPSGFDEHLMGNQGHRGNYDTPGKGRLIDRKATASQMGQDSCPL